MSRNHVRIWIVLSMGLSLCIAPFLVRGDQATRDRLEQNRQAIGSMTQSERDRLDRNFKAYQQMEAGEITTLEAFHQKLNQQDSGELNLALDQYHAWLETVQPFQRDKLKETTDPQERIALMNEMLQEQRNRDASRFMREFLPRILFGANWRSSKENLTDVQKLRDERAKMRRIWSVMDLFREAPLLSDSNIAKLMTGLEESVQIHLTQQDQSELKDLEGQARYMLLLNLMKDRILVRPQTSKKSGAQVLLEAIPQFEQAFEKLAFSFDNYVEDSNARDFIHQENGEQASRKPSLRIQVIILKTMLVNVFTQLEEANSPSRTTLEELFAELPVEEQDHLLELEAIDFYKELELTTRGKSPGASSGPGEVVRLFLSKETVDRFEMYLRQRQRSFGDRNDRPNGAGPGRPGGRPRDFNERSPGGRGGPGGRGAGGRPDRPPFQGENFWRSYDEQTSEYLPRSRLESGKL